MNARLCPKLKKLALGLLKFLCSINALCCVLTWYLRYFFRLKKTKGEKASSLCIKLRTSLATFKLLPQETW